MRILFVTQDFPPDVGGIQTYSWELARRLARSTSYLRVIAPRRPDAATFDRDVPFPITRILGRPDLLPLTGLPTVLRTARRERIDVAFHAQWQTLITSVWARGLTGWPRHIVSAAHGRELLFTPFPSVLGLASVYDGFRRWMLSQGDIFFPVSHYTSDLLRSLGVPSGRRHIVPNGTDPERFQPTEGSAVRERLGLGNRPVLLTVGRLVPRKGIDTVLRALPSIAERVPNVTYLVAGTGPDRDRLEALAEHLRVRERVQFLGRVPHAELPGYYTAADLFVMPARESRPDVEGFGLVFLEANACGTPVLGARTGGIPDAIVDGETGLLVPPDAPDALAEGATRVLTDTEFARTLAQQGRHRAVHEANWDHVADRVHTLLIRETT